MDAARALVEAIQFHSAGQLAQAEQRYRAVLAVDPHNLDANNNLGEILRRNQQIPQAIECYRAALRGNPNFSPAYSNLGLALVAMGDQNAAIAAFREAVRLNPNFADAHQHLGNILREMGRHEEALPHFARAIELNPNHAKAFLRAGLSLMELKRFKEAGPALERAVAIDPSLVEAHFGLGQAYLAIGRDDLAAVAWEKTLELLPDAAGARINLADIRTRQGRLTDAVNLLRGAIADAPQLGAGYNNLGNVLMDQGKLDEGIEVYREGLRRNPDDSTLHSNLLFMLNHHPAYDRARLFEEHLEWSRQHADHLIPASPAFTNSREPNRVLRIGYVSPDFRATSAAFFVRPLLRNHDRTKFFIKCYNDARMQDTVTEQLKNVAHEWQDTLPLTHEQFAEQVRRDRIDILIDLAVHAGWHRLLAFARRPAPVQMTYLGYPNTTGLRAIDYRITDVHIDPPGLSEKFHAEKLLRLPETYFCYEPPPSPDVGPLPAARNGFITFGSFNRLEKLSDPAIELWSRVLREIPDARLLMQTQGLADEPTREVVLEKFSGRGIARERFDLHGWSSTRDYLAQMNNVDLALDTFPFTGGTTTLHLMWMGVPTVTLAWDSPVGRMGVSLMRNIELPELIAESTDEFVDKTIALARNVPRLEQLRRTMRDRMRASPLMDAKRFVKNLEDLYRTAWKEWCDS